MVNKRTRTSSAAESVGVAEELPTTLPRGRWPRRFPTFTVTVMVALVLLVVLAPTIVSLTPLGPQMVASAAKERLDGSLEANSVSVGWISPVTLRGLTVKNNLGDVIATVDSVVVGKSLLGLLTNANDLGTITIDKPQLLVVARPDGSNLEDLIAPLMKQPSSGATPTVAVDVREGLVKLVDATTEQSWEFTPLAAHVESPRGAETAWKVAVRTKLGEAGAIADVAHVLGEASATRISLEADRFPLEPLQPIVARVLGQVRMAGEITGTIGAELIDGGKQQKLQFENVDARGIALAAPQYLGKDVLRLEQARANGTAQLADGVWQLRNLELQSDVAALSGSGDVRVSDFTSGKTIPQTDCDIRGVIDLARLLKLLPNTLRVREGVELTSGSANVSLVSQAAPNGRRFEASLVTKDVQAINNGRPVALREPVQLTASLLQTPQGWQIENLDAKSSFLTADVVGTPAKGQLTLQGDMNKLAAELDQFVDLGDVRLAGQLTGGMAWEQAAGGALSTNGRVNLTSFELAAPGVLPWQEDNLAVTFQGNGISLTGGNYGIGGGKLEVASANDRLDVTLEQGVRAISASSPLPLDVKLTGNLATWLPRLQAFVPLSGWQMSGPISIAAKANISTSRIDVPSALLRVQQLQAKGMGLHVQESQLEGQTQFSYDLAAGSLTTTNTLVRGTSVALSADKLTVQTGKEAKITGDVAARGDMSKVLAWFTDPQTAANSQFTGEGEAEASFTYESGITKANLKGQIANLSYAARDILPTSGSRLPAQEVSFNAPLKTMWEEPLVTFGGDAAYDSSKDAISLTKMQAQAGTSAVVATGTVSQLASRCQLDLNGEVKYDLATWTPKVQAVLGQSFDMYGSGSKPFEVHGPLFDPAASSRPGEAPLLPLTLTGKAGLGWQGMQWMALEVGASEVAAELKDSTVYVQPTKIPLSQGMLQVSPAIILRGSNWLVAQEQARVIDHVVITPEMCSAWIKYVAPLVADATQAQGKFSVDVEKALIPISHPKSFDTKGKFVVHNVTVGPGPLAMQLIGAAQQVKSFVDGKTGLEGLAGLATGGAAADSSGASAKQWLEIPEQDVPVDVVEGRVHHEGLTMHVKDITLRTSGSVGMNDQSLQLTCEIPIRDEWLKDKSYLAGLKGQTIKIPVGGTISRPELDTRGLVTFGRDLAFAAGRGAVEGQLNKGVEKGTGMVQEELQKGQNKIQEEVNKGKQKLEDELRNGLKGLFGK
jgi:hypothetical protein